MGCGGRRRRSRRKDRGGIGANVDTVKQMLDGSPDRFESRTGEAAKAVGRHSNATVWSLTHDP